MLTTVAKDRKKLFGVKTIHQYINCQGGVYRSFRVICNMPRMKNKVCQINCTRIVENVNDSNLCEGKNACEYEDGSDHEAHRVAEQVQIEQGVLEA